MLSMGAAHDDVLDVLYMIYNLKFGRIILILNPYKTTLLVTLEVFILRDQLSDMKSQREIRKISQLEDLENHGKSSEKICFFVIA